MRKIIFIRSYHRDLEWLRYCLASINKFVTGFDGVVVAVPHAEVELFGNAGIAVVGCDDLPDGYLGQQSTKIHADTFMDEDCWIVHLDSDCFVSAPFDLNTLFANGKPIHLHTPYALLPPEVPWKKVTEEALGFPVQDEYMRRLFWIISSQELRDFRQWFMANRGQPIAAYIAAQPLRRFSEFNAMGAWLWKFRHGSRSWVRTDTDPWTPLPLIQSWSYGGVDDAKRALFDQLLATPIAAAPAKPAAPVAASQPPPAPACPAMKPLLITVYDDAFEEIFWQDWLPGYSAFLAHHFELKVIKYPKVFGSYGSKKYDANCCLTIEATLAEMDANPDRLIIMADCDMRIYRDFWPEIEALATAPRFQMATSMDRMGDDPVHCAGFIVLRSTPETRTFYAKWAIEAKRDGISSVQQPFNELLKEGFIKCRQLPEIYWTAGLCDLPRTWEPGDAVPFPPENIAFHHSNFTIGVRHKRALMEAVRLKHASINTP